MIEQCIRHIKFEVFRTHVLNALYALVAFHVFLFLEQTNIVSKYIYIYIYIYIYYIIYIYVTALFVTWSTSLESVDIHIHIYIPRLNLRPGEINLRPQRPMV